MKKIYLLAFFILSLINGWAQSRQISGKVIEKSTGSGLQDVSVVVRGTTIGSRTDSAGNFSLTVNKAGKIELEVSLIGYGTQIINANTSPVTITMDNQTKALDEVVVIGYGTVRKRDLTGAVTSIKSDEIRKVPAQNPLESIQGKIAGADISRSSGSATSGVSIRIRGNRSIAGSNEPLYIVDGVQTGDISNINSNDIESMEFLKDASSTAIYGWQGANGIIIITTKKGSTGAPKVSFNSYYGISRVSRYPTVLDGNGFVALRREANRTTGRWKSPTDDPLIFNNAELAAIQNNQWVNYQDLLLKNGKQQDYQVGVSAGTDKTKVYLSLDYYNEAGVLRQDYVNRYNLRVNVDQTFNTWIKAGLQSQLTSRDQSFRRDPLNQANKVNPLGTVYDTAGNFILYPLSGAQVNPLADEQPNVYSSKGRGTTVVANVYLELKPFSGFTYRTNLGTNLGYSRTGLFAASTSLDRNGSPNLASYTSSNSRFINLDNVITYQKQIKDHSFTITALTSYIHSLSDNATASGQSQLIPAQLFYGLGNAPTNLAINSSYQKWNVLSFAGRLNYNYKGKYLLTLTDRADGASRLSEGNKWASFPSVAFAWRVSDENFMNKINVLSDLKLRLSYGVAGNSAIPPYGTQSSLTRVAFAYGETGAQGFAFSPIIGNPDLGWELSATNNIGVDFGLWKNRVTAAIDIYDTRTTDLLLNRGLPPTTGVQQVYQNIGKTRNRGVEVSVTSTNIRRQDFSWTTTATFTSNKEQIVSLVTEGVNDIGNGLFIGNPTQVFYDYEKIGVWQLNEEAEAVAFGQKPGDIKVRDLNGDKKIDAANDRKVLAGNNRPKWFGGLSNTVSYKGFDLNVYVFARFGQIINPDFLRRYHTQAQENSGTIINYWTPENPSNDYPRPNANLSLATMLYTSTIGYVDGSYIRLRNLSLGYTFPKFKKSFIDNLRLYVTGTNLLTWTRSSKLKEYDPERGGGESFPMTKTFVFGLNVGF